MSVIARTLGVSRSNLIERASKPSRLRGPYRKADDGALLAELRPIIDQRPTYGYRRVTALLILPDAETILALLPEWIDYYCEVHPHSGLKYRSPREFLRLSTQTQPSPAR